MIPAILIGIILFSMAMFAVTSWYRSTPAGRAALAENKRRAQARRAARSVYCTKHQIRKSMVPGGPDRMVWVYGPHRTQGNQCDGTEHRRVTAWW